MKSAEHFLPEFLRALDEVAKPLFEGVAAEAKEKGLSATVTADDDEFGNPYLQLKILSEEATEISSYSLKSNAVSHMVVHVESFGPNEESKEIRTNAASINRAVLETELAAFFVKSVGSRLEFVQEAHPVGF
ncbi:hypothetical protein [Pseudomonas sp. RIT-PI-AD]|uniref:hypothetical protein n=1 Tax=Pseudomonas sp. RIT-PI-AD TaxID=3035294 RepID=UPI0021D96897|nr:hypothetical protein [Pseudomonas sp. RIT-PI-AD]